MLQLPRLEDHMKTIDIDQSLSNRPYVEQKFLNNIKKIYQHAGKCDDQQNLKDILDATMVSTTEVVTDVSLGLHNKPNNSLKTKYYEITVFIHQHILCYKGNIKTSC